ncbi:reverse transcriptase domain-containing protein [Tenacibaculum mesophilum]|uniref:reverse transcriptase domain-containing protein n=1 Tax=Tenacibaculum mesophilum TaxID=104268 RepID=UPI0006498ED0|nr:reverse transcriptase domain-containing protein [Tenacibaculum mesophilum]
MKKKEWFRIKGYPHIGLPITTKDKKFVCSYIKNKEKIKKHSFSPFIHKKITSRKLRKQYDANGNILNEGKRTVLKPKERDIYYSSHLDANIFSYYGFILNKKYDKILKKKNLGEVITAYRKIPIIENGEKIRNKCNIDFANDVFNYIRQNKNRELVAITFDIKGFFDNLNHKKIKESWCSLYNWKNLEDDHYNVFRNITKFSFVEEVELFNLFKERIIIKTKSGVIKNKPIDKLKYLNNQRAIAFCKKKDLHLIRKKGLIRNNKYSDHRLRDFGICQGSPISSVLANIYMLDFDETIFNSLKDINGLYRRYSDDMVVVCEKKYKNHIIDLMKQEIENKALLEIQETKTQVFHFYIQNNKLVCGQEFSGQLNSNSTNRNFEYLGFSFDGETTSLKTSSLAKYYRKMKLNVRRSVYFSSTIDNNSNGQIFKRRLYKKFSYIGANRSRKYKRVAGTTNEWKITNSYNWGNYITYAKLASKTMDNNLIKSQIKNHWKNLNKYLK